MVERGNAPSTFFPVLPITEDLVHAAGTAGITNNLVDPLACSGVDPDVRVLSGGRSINPGWSTAEFNQPNNHSLVIRVAFGEADFLFTGDLEVPGIDALLHRYAGTNRLDVEVYAVGHHGAENGTTEPMLMALNPEIAVISVGNPNSEGLPMSAHDHGHPRLITLQRLANSISRARSSTVDIMVAQQGANAIFQPFGVQDAIYATARDGDIRVVARANGQLLVHTSR